MNICTDLFVCLFSLSTSALAKKCMGKERSTVGTVAAFKRKIRILGIPWNHFHVVRIDDFNDEFFFF